MSAVHSGRCHRGVGDGGACGHGIAHGNMGGGAVESTGRSGGWARIERSQGGRCRFLGFLGFLGDVGRRRLLVRGVDNRRLLSRAINHRRSLSRHVGGRRGRRVSVAVYRIVTISRIVAVTVLAVTVVARSPVVRFVVAIIATVTAGHTVRREAWAAASRHGLCDSLDNGFGRAGWDSRTAVVVRSDSARSRSVGHGRVARCAPWARLARSCVDWGTVVGSWGALVLNLQRLVVVEVAHRDGSIVTTVVLNLSLSDSSQERNWNTSL